MSSIFTNHHLVTCFFPYLQLHTWIKLLGIGLAVGMCMFPIIILVTVTPHIVGGAIELTVTGQKGDAPSNNHTSHSNSTDSGINLHVMGYVALFGNTFCMVRYFTVLW